ncbi:MAG: hypothetical protein GY869_20415, partial [Planctomycetes bacterium]|nr:hypothetical protein [Planctomycetota bacterium]
MKNLKLIVLTIATLTFFLSTDSMAAIPADERAALIALYDSANGDSWTNNSGWKDNNPEPDGFSQIGSEDTWYGITASDHVTNIALDNNNLSGDIPPELENLSNLNELSLVSNQLSGGIPPGLGNLSNLTTLNLNYNQLIGVIPQELGDLSNLTLLFLSANQLSGGIPQELGNLSNLQSLSLTDNQLSGGVPPELGNLSNLTALALNTNQLTGGIPPELGDLSSLWMLALNDNQLSGDIPSELGNLSNLKILFFNLNQLASSVPPELGNLSNLEYLKLNSNQLTGGIPPELGNLSNLKRLYLNDNYLVGPVPTSITNLVNLVNGGLKFCNNFLYTDDAGVRDFLNQKQEGGDWEGCQYREPPTVTTTPQSSITPYSASSGGNVTLEGGAPVTAKGVCWSESANPTTSDNHTTDGIGAGIFISSITGLTPNTSYHVRAYATNSVGTGYGEDKAFTTSAIPPSVTTTTPYAITPNSALSGGNVTTDGGAAVTTEGVCWSESANPTTSDSHTTDGTGAGIFTSSITGLTPCKTYHVRAYATNSEGTAYGNDITFETPIFLPTVSTGSATLVLHNSATLNGLVNPNCSETSYYFEYGKTTNYELGSTPPRSAGAGSEDVPVNENISGLASNTTYHFRIVANNTVGTTHGGDLTFGTLPAISGVFTDPATSIGQTSATLNGRVNPNNVSATYYFEYGETTNYELGSTPETNAGSGSENVPVNAVIFGLDPDTTYHFRIVANNTAGTTHGGDLTFKTLPEPPGAITAPAPDVTSRSAVLNGAVDPGCSETFYYFEYGTTTAYGSATAP